MNQIKEVRESVRKILATLDAGDAIDTKSLRTSVLESNGIFYGIGDESLRSAISTTMSWLATTGIIAKPDRDYYVVTCETKSICNSQTNYHNCWETFQSAKKRRDDDELLSHQVLDTQDMAEFFAEIGMKHSVLVERRNGNSIQKKDKLDPFANISVKPSVKLAVPKPQGVASQMEILSREVSERAALIGRMETEALEIQKEIKEEINRWKFAVKELNRLAETE